MTVTAVYQDLRFSFRLGVVIGIWLMPTPMPPRNCLQRRVRGQIAGETSMSGI